MSLKKYICTMTGFIHLLLLVVSINNNKTSKIITLYLFSTFQSPCCKDIYRDNRLKQK